MNSFSSISTAFRQLVKKWWIWGSFSLKIMIIKKRKCDSLLFYWKNNTKTFSTWRDFELEKKSIENELRISFINLARGDS